MRYGYQLYGLRISANLPRLEARSFPCTDWPSTHITIDFHQGQPLPAASAQGSWRLLHETVANGDTWQLLLAEGTTALQHQFHISNAAGELIVMITPTLMTPAKNAPSQEAGHGDALGYQMDVYWHNDVMPAAELLAIVVTWVFDVALGYVVRLCVPANLHGSALALDGRVVALLGHKGAGKSTLSAALVQAGWSLLADDHIALWPRQGQFWVEPGAPRLRLWPNSLSVVSRQAEELPRLYAFQEKRLLALREEAGELPAQYQATALPLSAIYLLEVRDAARTQSNVARLQPKTALYELLLRRFSTTTISPAHGAAELSVLAQIAQQIPVLRLFRPDGLETLPQVIDRLRGDFATYAAPAGNQL